MVLYPEFEFVLLFDHNQGHACKRHGALNALKMSQNCGETQPIMKETTIMSTTGYLGPHLTCLLDVGQVQSFVYNAEDLGLWYLSCNDTTNPQGVIGELSDQRCC